MDRGRRSTASTSAVPRPLALRHSLQDGETNAISQLRQRLGVLSEASPERGNTLSSPKRLIRKHGFHNQSSSGEMQSHDFSLINFREPDHLRTLAIFAVADSSDEDDQCIFINKDYLALWNPSLTDILNKNVPAEEVAFPGHKEQLDSLIRCIWPCGSENWPLSIDQLKEIIGPCCDWGMHPCLVSTISYYLHSNAGIPVAEKLKLASRCGNVLLLAGALSSQCRRDTIFDIVNRSSDEYQQIMEGSYAGLVAGKMLEHAARDGDEEYKEAMMDSLKQETTKFKEQCGQLIDFVSDRQNDNESESSPWCCLEVSCESPTSGNPTYFLNKAYLSMWSPVFRLMFYGDFADRRRPKITLKLDDGIERKHWHLFLNLIHPSYMCTLWRLVPKEYCIGASGRVVANSDRDWLDEIFSIIFEGGGDEGGVDALMQVFRLAHKFQVLPLLDFCVLMIEAKSEMSLADKIVLADTYHLPKLMEWCVGKLTTSRCVKRMFNENKQLVDSLSCNSHKILLERILELI